MSEQLRAQDGTRNLESQRRQIGDITYYDRGEIAGQEGRRYQRFAIATHFIKPHEDQAALVRRYVQPLYQPGDLLSFGAKVMGMCVGSVKTREEVKPGFFARLLWRFAGHNSTGIGMHEPYKLQMTIDIAGLPRVLLAAVLSALTKPFGIKGVFYKVCGHDIAGIDGFYPDSDFAEYHELAVINPPDASRLCDELTEQTGIPMVVMDANDFHRNQLGKSQASPLSDGEIQEALADNPSGQGKELTPFILIRKVLESA
ncbi:MAG: F420-0--gamma-glutamyl ligase [Clostridiales bacterium]|nr:F420-0--gamma-glutamyl ligase [Clostridiales bacterium]